jgi:uncharacterized protein YcfJ
MSRNPTAYFAIAGTLAFAPGGAVNAGQLNIPHINIPPPHINSTPPHLSIRTPPPSIRQTTVSKWSVPAAQGFSSATRAGSVQAGVMTQTGGGQGMQPQTAVGTLQNSGSGTQVGSTQGGAYTSTQGGAYTSTQGGAFTSTNYSGGYSTAGKANANPSYRCRSKGGANCP